MGEADPAPCRPELRQPAPVAAKANPAVLRNWRREQGLEPEETVGWDPECVDMAGV